MARKYFRKSEESPASDETIEISTEVVVEEETVQEADDAPAKPNVVKRVAYKALYAVSFGAVFSSLLLRKILVPKDSVIESALHDGAVAARHAFEEKERMVEEVIRETEEFLSTEELPAATA